MKILIAIALACLVATASAQGALTIETCLYDIGIVTASIANVKAAPTNTQNKEQMKQNVQKAANDCLNALNSLNQQLAQSAPSTESKITSELCLSTLMETIKLLQEKQYRMLIFQLFRAKDACM